MRSERVSVRRCREGPLRAGVRLAAAAADAMLGCVASGAAAPPELATVPHLKNPGQEAYRQFLASETHRAFTAAPGGAWSWASDAPTPELAESSGLQACRAKTPQRSVLYAVDDEIVFDAANWHKLWGPTSRARRRAGRPSAPIPGERFTELALRDDVGKTRSLAAWARQAHGAALLGFLLRTLPARTARPASARASRPCRVYADRTIAAGKESTAAAGIEATGIRRTGAVRRYLPATLHPV
jgi:hypothetical protein